MKELFFAFLISWVASMLIVFSNAMHGQYTNDNDTNSVQKFHAYPVPRIGGLAIFLGLLAAWLIGHRREPQDFFLVTWGWILLAGAPVFIIGLLEDVTKKVSARWRLIISFLSASLVFFFVHIHFARIGWPWFDHAILSVPVISFLITVLFISGVTHAANLIDGFNGLMLGVSSLMFLAVVLVSHWANDMPVFYFSLSCVAALTGLFVVNFPYGKIFTGDGGAYFVGFLLSVTVLMLVQRNPQVSAWFPFLLLMYPLFETIFSIYRKVILRKTGAMKPDGAHLHMLIHRRVVRHKRLKSIGMVNSMTSVYLWAVSLIAIVPAVLCWNNNGLSLVFCLIFPLFYLRMYWYLVLFKRKNMKRRT